MTMPKKGIRKIVVRNKAFKYIIKPLYNHRSGDDSPGGRLTVESYDGNHYCSRDMRDQIITPAIVRAYIEENFDFLTGKDQYDLSKV